MYKLFLTFRYLTRKAIVVFPILVVWLCVMMMIIVTSIMGGFVDRVQEANRQLLGDVVIDAPTQTGWPYYKDLQQELKKIPEVQLSTPVVRAFGLINLPEYNYTSGMQLVGIDPAARSKISGFADGLFRQHTAPKQAVEDLSARLPATGRELQDHAKKVWTNTDQQAEDLRALPITKITAKELIVQISSAVLAAVLAVIILIFMWRYSEIWRWLGGLAVLGLIFTSVSLAWNCWNRSNLEKVADQRMDEYQQVAEKAIRAERTLDLALNLPPEQKYKDAASLTAALVPSEPSFVPPEDAVQRFGSRKNMPDEGCFLGIDVVPLFKRDSRGNYKHQMPYPYVKVLLTAVPVKPKGVIAMNAAYTLPFVVVDDSYTRVFDVDSTYVYIPFARAQEMAGMKGYTDGDDVYPDRCSELLLKVKDSDDPIKLKLVTDRINQLIGQMADTHRGMGGVMAQTWDEKQARYIGAVRNEKNMITFILGLMSLVVLVVIFLIFYMIVRDKTRDIGIIKALGGSEEGVAGIFMMYGLFIGFVGGMMGMITGVLFVHHTNEIHEWIYRTTGIMIWNRSVYLFDRIPDTVNPNEVLLYVGAALIAGLLGALIPALVAGTQNPVRAVRYE